MCTTDQRMTQQLHPATGPLLVANGMCKSPSMATAISVKTPFSIEDILFQNGAASAGGQSPRGAVGTVAREGSPLSDGEPPPSAATAAAPDNSIPRAARPAKHSPNCSSSSSSSSSSASSSSSSPASTPVSRDGVSEKVPTSAGNNRGKSSAGNGTCAGSVSNRSDNHHTPGGGNSKQQCPAMGAGLSRAEDDYRKVLQSERYGKHGASPLVPHAVSMASHPAPPSSAQPGPPPSMPAGGPPGTGSPSGGPVQFTSGPSAGVLYATNPYNDPAYLQMALGAYLAPSSTGYKTVDPYFLSQGIFASSSLFPGAGCPDIALGLGMGMSALRHCRRRKARTVFSDPQLTGLEKRFEAQRPECYTNGTSGAGTSGGNTGSSSSSSSSSNSSTTSNANTISNSTNSNGSGRLHGHSVSTSSSAGSSSSIITSTGGPMVEKNGFTAYGGKSTGSGAYGSKSHPSSTGSGASTLKTLTTGTPGNDGRPLHSSFSLVKRAAAVAAVAAISNGAPGHLPPPSVSVGGHVPPLPPPSPASHPPGAAHHPFPAVHHPAHSHGGQLLHAHPYQSMVPHHQHQLGHPLVPPHRVTGDRASLSPDPDDEEEDDLLNDSESDCSDVDIIGDDQGYMT
uniref:Uncharacterized protein n=1 Tax=Anopheles albimanus TaxID=7167 RepID=A0A182F1H3_ANOAL